MQCFVAGLNCTVLTAGNYAVDTAAVKEARAEVGEVRTI